MSIEISNKRYATIYKDNLNNKDIVVTTNGNYYAEEGYTGLGLVRVQIPEPIYETITINPSIKEQIIQPSEGYDAISNITVNAVTKEIDSNIKAGNIKKGISILGVNGSLEFKTEDIEITPSIVTQTITPTKDGFYNIKVNAVTASIDSNIKATNIKQGISILGVTGTVAEAKFTTRDITENGLFTPEDPYNGFSQVNVNVRVNQEELDIIPSTKSQTFKAEDNFHGFSPVNVAAVTADIDSNIIPANIKQGVTILGVEGTAEQVKLTTLTTKENGTFTPEEPYNGFAQITVDVDTVNNTDITITNEGTYTASKPYSGYGTVTVDLTWIREKLEALNAGDADTSIHLQDKTITTAGSYTADSGYDGLGTVTINLDWVDQAIEEAKAGTPDGNADEMIGGTLINISTDADIVRDYAFYYQTTLKKVILTSAQSIGQYAFANSGITELTINTSLMCTLNNSNAFNNTSIQSIKVPSSLVSTYKADSVWSNFASKITAS